MVTTRAYVALYKHQKESQACHSNQIMAFVCFVKASLRM